MTEEAVLSDNGTCRNLCRKRQTPSDVENSEMDGVAVNGMPKHGRHETLTLRALMAGKEVGTIIGKNGENIRILRAQTGACVKITDGSSPERIITVSGSMKQVIEAFECICQTFEDDHFRSASRLVENNLPENTRPPITLRLLIPEQYCGSIIGKGGAKIKHIREITGAHIQVASQVLPNSSDRPITLSGSARSVASSINQLCQIFVRLCFQDIGIPYQPQPTYAIQAASRLIHQDRVLSDQLPRSSIPAFSPEPLVFSVTPDLFSGTPLTPPSSYLDFAGTFPIASHSKILYSPESVLSIPLLVPTLVPAANPTAPASLNYSPIPALTCQSTFEPKSFTLPPNSSAFVPGNGYPVTSALSQADTPHIPLNNLMMSGIELSSQTQQSGLTPGGSSTQGDQSSRPHDHPPERPPLMRELEQLMMNCTAAVAGTASTATSERMQADAKAAAAVDRVYQTLLTATQPSHVLTEQKNHLPLQQIITSPCVKTPDQVVNVPCPKTPNVRNISHESHHKVEMFLPNDIVGCIIGRGGNKINEIRQISQATIKISSGEDGMAERRITITGTSTAIRTAQAMINNSLLSREFMHVIENREAETAIV